jgi:hypothetical protein
MEMKHCSLGQYYLLASGNQPNQNLTRPKIHTRNKGKFLHKRIRSGKITEWKENLVTGHLLLLRTMTSKEKSWHRKNQLGSRTEGLVRKQNFCAGKR